MSGEDAMAGATSDVGLFVGPIDAPDRFELLVERSGGGEGRLYQGRFRQPDAGVLLVAMKAIGPRPDASVRRAPGVESAEHTA